MFITGNTMQLLSEDKKKIKEAWRSFRYDSIKKVNL